VTEPIAHVLRTYLVETYLPHTGSATLRDDEDLFDTGILDSASGILDSASALALLFFVEERFGISVPDDDFLPENFASIIAATTYIKSRQILEAQLEKVSEGGA